MIIIFHMDVEILLRNKYVKTAVNHNEEKAEKEKKNMNETE